MPTFLVSFPSKDEQDIKAVHKLLFAELKNQSQPPVVGTQRYVEHQFSAFAQEPLDALAPRLISQGLGPCRIEIAQIQDAIGLVHTTYSLLAEDRVTLLPEPMTARVLEVIRVVTNNAEVEYDGWEVSYETLQERG